MITRAGYVSLGSCSGTVLVPPLGPNLEAVNGAMDKRDQHTTHKNRFSTPNSTGGRLITAFYRGICSLIGRATESAMEDAPSERAVDGVCAARFLAR